MSEVVHYKGALKKVEKLEGETLWKEGYKWQEHLATQNGICSLFV